MSKRIILGIVVLVIMASASFAVSNPDGLFFANNNNIVTEKVVNTTQTEKKPASIPNPFADVTTNFFVDANSQSNENGPVSQAQVAAGVTIQKGAFNVQFTHSRAYSRFVDSYSGYVEPTFQGTVNNRITFGATFSPDVINPAAASTVAVGTPAAPSALAQPSASVSSSSAVN